MRNVILALIILQASTCWTQSLLVDRDGIIQFRASKETFVPVKANNNKASAILDLQTGGIASVVLVREFVFKNSLMQEHFNENYMESEFYPKITFEGSIIDFDAKDLSATMSDHWVTGELYLHGVKKELHLPLKIIKRDATLYLSSEFKVRPEDFKIKIPKIVRYKIAKEVIINLEFKLQTP